MSPNFNGATMKMTTPVYVYHEATGEVSLAEYTYNPIRGQVEILVTVFVAQSEDKGEDDESDEEEPEYYDEDAEAEDDGPGEESDEYGDEHDEDAEETEYNDEGDEGEEAPGDGDADADGGGDEEDEDVEDGHVVSPDAEEVEGEGGRVIDEEAEDGIETYGGDALPDEFRELVLPISLDTLKSHWFIEDDNKTFVVYESLVGQLAELSDASMKRFLEYCFGREGSQINGLKRYFGEVIRCRQDVMELLSSRNVEGMKQVQRFLERLEEETLPDIKDLSRQVKFRSDDGDEFDFDRFRAGQDFWRKSEREERVAVANVTVFVDLTVPYFINASDLLWRAVAGVAIAKLLEDKGYRVELWTVDGHEMRSKKLISMHRPKKLEDALDVGSIMNCMTAWWFRGCCVPLAVQYDEEVNGAKDRYQTGWAVNVTQDELDKIDTCPNRITISGVFSEEAALRLLEAELTKLSKGN